MPMVNETKPFFYLKINRNDKLGLECINHWMEIVQHLDCEFCFVCDNDGLKEKIKKQYDLSDSRFIYSYREQLEPLVNGIIPFGVISTHNWTNIASALLTPILHSKINGIDRYWNIDADDTFLYIDVKKRCEILKHAERIAEEENFDMLSLDMWHSQCNGKHWTFGVAYIRNEKDFLDILEKNKSLLTKIYKSGEVSRRLPKNLDGIFTNLHIERLIRINSFYPENVFFRHVRKINYWHHGKIIYTKPILNDWTRPIYWDDNLPKYSELPIYSGSKRIDIGIEISNSLAFIKQNRMFDEYYDILLALGTPDSYREMLSVATALANQGDSHAMIRLGRAYRDGKGVGQDLEKAAEWMRKAANKNIAWAGNELFDILWKIGTPDSYREMVSVADTFAKQNDTNAMIRLGRAYRDGKGVGQDLEKAMEWMRKAANKNSVSASNELFDILWKIGTPDSYREMVSVADTFANQGNPHAMIRLGRAYRDGKGVGQDLEKAAEWMRKAANKNIAWAGNELFDILWKIGTPDSYREMVSVADTFAKQNDTNAMIRLGRAYRDGKGVGQDLEKAAEWMRKAANKNSVSAGNELFDILWKIGTPDSYREMVSVADTFANQGNPHAMIRLGRAYRDGKGVGQDLEKAAEWIGQAVDMGAKWASNELVQLLLRYTKNTELAYQKAFEICIENKNEDWAKKILPYLYYNGIGTEQNIKTAKKMWIEQNVSGLSGNIEPAFVINPDLLQYDEIVLAGTKKEILLLFSICLQYNIRPDYYVTLSDCEELPEFYGNRLVLDDKTWTKADGKAFLILSETKLKSVADECIFYIGADEPCSNMKNRNELLTPSAIFENEQLLICMDRNIGLEMKFSKPIAYTDEIDSDPPNGKILIVCSSNIALIENLMKKNKVFVDFEPFYTSAVYIYNNSRNKIETIDLTQINKRYDDGKAIFNELDPKYQYLIAYDIAMGDQFRILSKRKGTDYSMRRFIVSENAKDLLKVQNTEGLVISSEQHKSLITYMSMSENYHTNVLLLGYRPIYPGVGWKSDLNTIAQTGSALEYNLIDIEGLNCNDPHYLNLISTEKKRKILLNPYGNNIRKRSSAETTKSYELFESLTIYLKDLGYSVYTNTPFTDQKEIPGTIRYEETIAEFVQNSTTFDFVISVFTGFIEVAMLTKVNLIVLNPGKETRIRYSKLCEHDNYWEYDILSKDVKHILDEIKNIVRVKIT